MSEEFIILPKSQYTCLSEQFVTPPDLNNDNNILSQNFEEVKQEFDNKRETVDSEHSSHSDSGENHSGSELNHDESNYISSLPTTPSKGSVRSILKADINHKKAKRLKKDKKGKKEKKNQTENWETEKKPVKKNDDQNLVWSQVLKNCKSKGKMEKLHLFKKYFELYMTKKIQQKFENLVDLILDAFSRRTKPVKNEECFYLFLSKLPCHVLIQNVKKLEKYSKGNMRDWFRL